MSAAPSFAFVEDVTSDVSFVAWGDSLEALFAAAANALLAATLAEPATVEARVEQEISLCEPDLELLLLRFLNELVFQRDARDLLLRVASLRIDADGEARLEGTLAGERVDRARHALVGDVKAATAHGLRVGPEGHRFEARVTLDV
ncbi:MAG: archease [Myxococcota bacterium]